MDVWVVVENRLSPSPSFFVYASASDMMAHLDAVEREGKEAEVYLTVLQS